MWKLLLSSGFAVLFVGAVAVSSADARPWRVVWTKLLSVVFVCRSADGLLSSGDGLCCPGAVCRAAGFDRA